MTQVHILFHSVSGHTYKLAQALGEGVRGVAGCQARLLRIPELPGLAPVTMSGIDQRADDFAHVPEAKIEDLLDCDGLAIGSAVYWGNMSYATKHFLDSAARLWGFTSPDKPCNPPMHWRESRRPCSPAAAAGSFTIQRFSACGRSWASLE